MILKYLNVQGQSIARIRWWLLAVSATILISFVVLMGLLRLALPYLTSYENEIKKQLQDVLHRPVTISRVDAGWHWFSPQLKLINVNILKKDKKTQLIHFGEVVFEFNVIDNLINFRLEPSVVTLNATSLNIERDKEGLVYVQGVPLELKKDIESTPDAFDGMFALLSNKELRLENTTLHWDDKLRATGHQTYNNLNMAAQVSDSGFGLKIETEVPKSMGRNVELVAAVTLIEKDWVSKVYINAKDMSLKYLMRYIDTPQLSISSKLNAQLWLNLKNLDVQSIAGDFSALDIEVVSKKQPVIKKWSSKKVSSAFQVKRSNDEWTVVVDNLNVLLDKKKWNDVYFSLKYKESDHSLGARFDYLDLSDLGDVVANLPLNAAWINTVSAINPVGELSKAEFYFDDWKKPNNWLVKARFNNLGVTVPGKDIRLDGLSGRLSVDKNNGKLELSSKGAMVTSKFFNDPLSLNQLDGALDIQKVNDIYLFSSGSIISNIDGVEVQSRIKYEAGEKPFLDMQVGFQGASAGWFNAHRTDKLFGKNVASWLSSSIRKGEFRSADIMYHGLISDFPFRANEGVFQAIVEVNNGELKYRPDWPEIKDISARFFMENKKIIVDRATGRINKNSFITNSVTTIDLKENTHVVVSGDVETNAEDANDFFVATPLKKGYLAAIKYTDVDGRLTTSLNLDIPLNSKEKVNVSGNVVLNNNKIRVKDYGYVVERVNGVVDFNNAFIGSKNLTGFFKGNEVSAVLETSRIKAVNSSVLTARLKSDVASLLPSNKHVARLFSGISNWDLVLGFTHPVMPGDQALSLKLKSDLVGLESSLPVPFSKHSAGKADFELGLDIYDSSSSFLLHYDDKLNMNMRWSEGFKNVRSDIQIQNGPYRPLKDGVNLTAKLNQFNLKEWGAVVSPFLNKSNKKVSYQTSMNLNFDIQHLQYGVYKLNDVVLTADLSDDDWLVNMSSNEVVGNASIPKYLNNDEPLVMDFKKLDLSSLFGFEKEKVDHKDKQILLSAEDIPPLKIQASDFTYKNYKFNSMNLVTSNTSYGLTVHTFDVKGENLSLKLKGNWFSKKNTPDHSNFRIEIESDDVGHMLSFYDFTKSIKKGNGKAIIDWQWAASPLDFDWKLVTGRMQVEVEDGKFVDIEPGAGRLLGMFSLRALPKRFFLDFSDTFSEGFKFNSLSSNANFNRGHLYTSKTQIAGDSADVYFRGRIGLADKDYDQIMSVVPRISSGVSGWIAIAQGAVVGLTAYIGQKLLGVDEAAKNQYHISGSWSDPVIKKIGSTIDESNESGNKNE